LISDFSNCFIISSFELIISHFFTGLPVFTGQPVFTGLPAFTGQPVFTGLPAFTGQPVFLPAKKSI
jgi:hypothetical protein